MSTPGVVYVIDDDVSMCDLIQATLTRAGLKVRTFASAEAFSNFNLLEDCGDQPCCILLDVVMPGQSGLEFLEKRFGGDAPCPVIIITARASVDTAVKSMKLGAVDFLEKPFSSDALTNMVLQTLKNCPSGSAIAERQAVRGRIAQLSPRERELLDAIVRGNSTKMIANRLNISARTVDHHRANLMDKMRASNVADLVRMAMEVGFTHAPASAPE